MEEQNATNTKNPNEATALKARPENKPAKKNKQGFGETIKDYKAEFKKIIWPGRQETAKKTVTVIVTSLLVGVIIFCMDGVYTLIYNAVLSLLS